MSKTSIEVLHGKTLKVLSNMDVDNASTVFDVKKLMAATKSHLYPDRIMLRAAQTGKPLKDEEKVSNLMPAGSNKLALFFKDLGPQVGWTTVFLTEYAGPLFIYLLFYLRPTFIYGHHKHATYHYAVHLAAAAWTFHYAKRLFETVFIHRFSHATMPIGNIFKNSIYYWGFAAFVAYYVNHPLYTPPTFGCVQITIGAVGFILSEMGNFSIHYALRHLRPAGSKERKIPFATSNPFTQLFNFVSCPNYTYEMFSWLSFTLMTQCLPALIFTVAGAYQMCVWAQGKHRNYKREFEKYPKGRKAMIPFVI